MEVLFIKTYYTTSILAVITLLFLIFDSFIPEQKQNVTKVSNSYLTGIIVTNKDNILTLKDEENQIFQFENSNINKVIGTKLSIEYKDNKIINYQVLDESPIPLDWLDDGLFQNYYLDSFNKLQTLSLEEKISQLLLVHYTNDSLQIQEQYQFGGFIFFEKDFKNKTKKEVKNMIQELQKISKIPILTTIDEEGGKVSRISSNPNLVAEPFKSSQELYNLGGFSLIQKDVINKSQILSELGLNLNLAPVVDVSTNPNDYIYSRTLGLDTTLTSIYAQTVIEASKNTNVSYTLKHFPGYGSNLDTHKGTSIDSKSYEDILKYDIPPFEAGIKAGAEAIMNSHNIVQNIDSTPSSLSKKMHELLRNDLHFTGIIITDDLNMGALKNIENIETKALLAGNNILITSNYKNSFNNIKNGINSGLITEAEINKLVFRVIAWKYYKNLLT